MDLLSTAYLSYIHFSIIFILGLSLPVLFLLIFSKAVVRWQYFVLALVSALALLYFLSIPSTLSYLGLANSSDNAIYLVLAAVLIFVFFVINTCWLFVKKGAAVTSKNTRVKTISEEDLFTYTHDPATNLPTAQQASKYFDLALKAQKDKSFAAVVFKPINFQQVNTLLGHHNSDILLLQLAYCLQKKVEDNHSLLSFDHSIKPMKIARLQGLHFLVIFDLTSTNHKMEYVVNNLCQQLSNAVPTAMSFKSFSLNFELAFGVSISGEHGLNVNEIISHAGDALLDAEMRQQQVSYFDNNTLLYTEHKLARMQKLREDILDQNLRWYLQPQININTKEIIGFELMVHWYESPNEEPLSLPDFIDIAEHSG